jgi:Tfp pilus assembly protein PilF
MADYYLQQGKATESLRLGLEAVEKAQRFNPVDANLQRQEAELALQIGDLSRSREAYHKATQLNPKHYAPYDLLAFFYQQSGQPEKALPLYCKALSLNPLDEELARRIEQLEESTGGNPATRSGEETDGSSTAGRFTECL